MNQHLAGIDLGKASAKFTLARLTDDGKLIVDKTETVVHEGDPLGTFSAWYRKEDIASCRALGATGLHADEIGAPALTGLPQDACLEAALRVRTDLQGPLNIVSVGARGYSVLTRDENDRVQFLENEKCSSGTGETMVKSAGRFGLELEEADRIASQAEEMIPITARCSVFAKSEMTHFGNQGRPVDQIFRGYFDSIARYVTALLVRVRVSGPVYLVGGGSLIRTLRERLQKHAGAEVIVPEGALLFEAMGAARIAADQAKAEELPELPENPQDLIHAKQRRFEVLAPVKDWKHRVTVLEAPPVPEGAAAGPTILGIDLGSTGSKAVLTSIETGEIVLDVYDRTRGNPVEAAQRLTRTILDRVQPDVRAIGLTGSGREAAATVVRAAFPDHEDRIVVINEIVAHGTAAIRCDEADGKSLSVVEIGGQDAKFIQIADGQIIESDMNKACSAGTGSFLEEQAVFYGVHDIPEFTRLAQKATRPPNLGQMCTVFVAEAAAEAHNQGFGIADLFGGFQYSVIQNYKNRVMGQRTFGQRIFFQGKPASGPSLPWTLAAVTGRDVIVPPNPGAMGAWGIGLCTLKEMGKESLTQTVPFELKDILQAEVAERDEFQCKDPKCATLCNIERTTVAVAGTNQVVYSGGACPKFEISTAASPKLPQDAPSAFDEREALLKPFYAERKGKSLVGVSHTGSLAGLLPWAVTFLSELGLGVRVHRSDSRSLSRGEERCYSYDSCAPVKVAHGVADGEVDLFFGPKILAFSDRDGRGGKTCASTQGAHNMVENALRARGRDVTFVMPAFSLQSGPTDRKLLRELKQAAKRLGADPSRVPAAARRAHEAQVNYQRELAAIGRRTLSYARSQEIPVVIVCGSLHVIFDPAINAGIPTILRQNGVLALPMDCYPIPKEIDPLPRIEWGDANRALRASLAARERGDVFPLLLSSFGCGPASFAEQIFAMLMHGYPHTALETDVHGGKAGYVTRIQSFLHGVRKHDGRPSPVPAERLRIVAPLKDRPLMEDKDAQLVCLAIGDRIGPLSAASYRALGFDAVSSGPTSPSGLSHGRHDCSGKECLAYQLIWGGFREHLVNNPPEKRTVLLQVTGQGMCRNCMFSIKDQMSIEHMGLSDKVSVRHLGSEPDMKAAFMERFWASTLGWDILNQFAAYHRPLEQHPGEVDAIHERHCDALESWTGRQRVAGLRGYFDRRRHQHELFELMEDASREYAELGSRTDGKNSLRTVLLTGDIYVRLDDFASDGLVRRLNGRGLQVVVDPLCVTIEYMSEEKSAELVGLPTGGISHPLYKMSMVKLRREMYEIARKRHPWLPMPAVPEALKLAKPILDRYPIGEAPITIGSVLHAWHEGQCDGVAVVGPWGCGPALIAEGLLRHQRDIPMLFLYADGSPMDERKLNSFAYRLRRSTPRVRREGAAPVVDQGAPASTSN
jgi:activator of 2-hydroxyglutaryl-CoA dehydratase/predicted nucleotide-binding protein (sugar kinase/HSP70/actin superfamily)